MYFLLFILTTSGYTIMVFIIVFTAQISILFHNETLKIWVNERFRSAIIMSYNLEWGSFTQSKTVFSS